MKILKHSHQLEDTVYRSTKEQERPCSTPKDPLASFNSVCLYLQRKCKPWSRLLLRSQQTQRQRPLYINQISRIWKKILR